MLENRIEFLIVDILQVLGKQNIPVHGPVIFTGNHMNQFVDAAVILVTNPHKVGFLVAEKSFKKRIIGDFARAAGGIPVSRPQDLAKKYCSNAVYYAFDRMEPLTPSYTCFVCVVVVEDLGSAC